MAVTLTAAATARIDCGDYLYNNGAWTVAVTLTPSGGLVANNRIVGQWSNVAANQNFVLVMVDTTEIGFVVANGAGASYSVRTTDMGMVTGTTYRIVALWYGSAFGGPHMDIYANGVQKTTVAWFSSASFAQTANSSAKFEIGYETSSSTACVDGDYSEVAVWIGSHQPETALAYTKGFSPRFLKTLNAEGVLYLPLENINNLQSLWEDHFVPLGPPTITNTGGTTAGTHALLIQPRSAVKFESTHTETTFDTFPDGTVSHPLTWLEHYVEDPVNSVPASSNRTYAEVDLCDRSTYYLGYKAPYVLEWAHITRGLSDHQGNLEHLSFGATCSDTSRYFRGLLADAAGTRFFTNRPAVERMIDDDDRRVEGVPRLVANGFISDYEPLGGLKFRLACSDWLRRKGTRSRKSFQKWQPLIIPEDFDVNTTPRGLLNKPAPVIYGSHSDTEGAYAPVYTGIRLCPDAVYRTEFLIAGHACKGIPTGEVYVDGVQVSGAALAANWIIPGTAEWTGAGFTEQYLESFGRRYFTLYVERAEAIALNLVTADEVSPGTARLTINIDGIETIGDGTGTLITSLVLQCQHFAENPGDRPWNAQDWVNTSPFFFSAIPALTLVDRASFAAVDALVNLDGAGVIGFNGEAIGTMDVLARFCLSGDFQIGINRFGQLIAAYEPASAPATMQAIDDVTNIEADSLTIQDDVPGRFWNIQPYRYAPDYSGRHLGDAVFVGGVRIVPPDPGGWLSAVNGDTELRDSASITNYDQEIAGQNLDLHFIRDSADALAVVTRRLNRYKNPLRSAQLTVPLSGTSVDLGDIFTVSAVDGISATGWTDRPLRCVRHELNPNQNTVTLEAYDIQRVWDAV
jgi:hypothetical protein